MANLWLRGDVALKPKTRTMSCIMQQEKAMDTYLGPWPEIVYRADDADAAAFTSTRLLDFASTFLTSIQTVRADREVDGLKPGQCFEVVTFEDDGKGDCLLRNDAGEPVQCLVVCALTLRLALIVACSWQPA